MAVKITDMAAAAAAALTDLVEITQDPSGTPLTKSLALQKVKDLFDTFYSDLAHAARHANGGADELNVAGLSGVLADPQMAAAHDLGGAEHNTDTLANLNSKINDLIATYGGVRDIGVGTLAQRPAAGTANRFFYTTDEDNLYLDNGTSWQNLKVEPDAHASTHLTAGSDPIQLATNAQEGLASAAQITDLETNTVHSTSDGKDHSDVVLNNTHRADTANPHSTDVGNLGSGTLAELNAAITDATLDDSSAARTPTAHAASHTDGTDDIQDASDSQKGLLTAAAQTVGGQKTLDTAPRITPLDSGDEIITTDTNGEMQESGAKVESAPTGGSGVAVVEYASAPTSPPTGFFWIEAVDADTKAFKYFNGTDTFSVQLGKE